MRKKRRTSLRGQSSKQLARALIEGKHVVFVTGAGLSVASGVRPFRGDEDNGLWEEVIWKTATRSSFRKDPLKWYNDFWLPHFHSGDSHKPNEGHIALKKLCSLFPKSCHIITQNVDGLHEIPQVMEAHGRIGLYKCIPEEDSDTDSDSDEDENRPVHLGHRRKSRLIRQKLLFQAEEKKEVIPSKFKHGEICRFQQSHSIQLHEIEPKHVRHALQTGKKVISSPPICPACKRPVPPQALLFDEGYHSHDFYQFERMEENLADAQVIVFVGTSFQVQITTVALEHARDHAIPVFNFNTKDMLEPSARLNVENILGECHITLPRLLNDVEELLEESQKCQNGGVRVG